MTKVKINNKEYDIYKLSDEAKAQLVSLQFCDQELQRLEAQTAAYQTAWQVNTEALNEALTPAMGEKISFD